MSVMWKELTAEDLRAKAAENAIVVLPVASMEQHGPHLPVGVDTFLCEAVCKGGAELAVKDVPAFGPGVAERYPEGLVPQGVSAELIAAKWSIGREAMDAFATASHTKAARA